MCLLFFARLQVLIEVPYVLIQASAYALITYSMIGFEWTAAKFFWFLFVLYFSLISFTFYGMMMVALTPNSQLAQIVASFFYALFNLFSGFLIPKPVSFSLWQSSIPFAPNCCHALKSKALVFPSVDLELFFWRTLFLVLQSLNLTPSHTSQLIKKTTVLGCADDSTMVDLVLLDLSSGLDTLRSHCLTVWRHNYHSASCRNRWKSSCEGLRKHLFRIQT